jgi:hypothetical protein
MQRHINSHHVFMLSIRVSRVRVGELLKVHLVEAGQYGSGEGIPRIVDHSKSSGVCFPRAGCLLKSSVSMP